MPARTETFLSNGHPIRLTGFEPDVSASHRVPALVLLHGAGGNTDFWLEGVRPLADRLGAAVYAIHYFDRTGIARADPATLTDPSNAPRWLDTIADGLRTIAARSVVAPDRIGLIGVSLGAFLALALATRMQEPRPRCIVSVSGGLIEPYATQLTRRFPPTLILHGTVDPIVPSSLATELDQKLTAAGVPHRLELVSGEGHWFSSAAQRRLLTAVGEFLAVHL